ncbi:MAG: hypothetical protein JNL83_23145, partial [Myxococcales bacterium]|nr:hypothetical protein [Myxococcales bacterium]
MAPVAAPAVSRRLFGWVIALAACGDVTAKPDAPPVPPDAGPDLNEGATSGARLRLRYVDFGGLRTLAGVRDLQRDENCTPTQWFGGKAYCVPDAGNIVYSNAQCTQRLGQVYRDAACSVQKPPPAYFLDYEYASACNGAPARLFPRMSKVAATQYYFKQSDGSCAGPITTTTSDYYSLGPEVPLTELAETPLSAPATTGRLGQRFYESADGLRYPLSYRVHDALLGIDCYPEYLSAGATTGRCIPEDAAYAGDFRDAACTLPAVEITATCTKSKFAVKFGDCPYDEETFYNLGVQLSPTVLYYDTGSACMSFPPTQGATYYGVGSAVTLATLTREKGDGTRLQPIYFSTAEGLRARDSALFDQMLMSECFPTTQPDGSIVCMPNAYSVTTFYTESTCTTPIKLMSVYRGAASCSPPPLPSYAYESTKDAATCSTSYALHHVGAAYTGPRYRKTSTACSLETGTTSLYYRVETQVPNSMLVSG